MAVARTAEENLKYSYFTAKERTAWELRTGSWGPLKYHWPPSERKM
jgi:hypothetical protein